MKKKNPLKKQVGGNHYKKDFVIQPVEFIEKNEIGFALGNVIKYLLRDKDDRVQDLLKAKHYIDLHLALTYNVDPDGNKLDET
tara:strand:+ start:606 stop:854 length:249 start_codon:yes stop_codon:yes gene_type:complete